MPVEFLTDVQAGAYDRFAGLPSRMQLDRFFFLDDGDLGFVGRRRGDHNGLGFAVQLATVRFLGTFLANPGDVPDEVVDYYVAAQLDIAPASMATYTQREKTRLEHQWEIAREDFVDAEAELLCGSTTGRGRRARGHSRSSTARLGGCASARCCCPG